MKEFLDVDFDKTLVLIVIVGLFWLFQVNSGDKSKYIEDLLSGATGCLFGLVRSSGKKEG